MCLEMRKFREELDKRDIVWRDASSNDAFYKMDRTHFDMNGNIVSVVNGYGSYGGVDLNTFSNRGLLEVMIGENEPIGYLTCEQAISLIFEGFVEYD